MASFGLFKTKTKTVSMNTSFMISQQKELDSNELARVEPPTDATKQQSYTIFRREKWKCVITDCCMSAARFWKILCTQLSSVYLSERLNIKFVLESKVDKRLHLENIDLN